jgi:hypothetical protein
MNAELIRELDDSPTENWGATVLVHGGLVARIREALVNADSQFMRCHTKGVEDGMAAAERHQQHILNERQRQLVDLS